MNYVFMGSPPIAVTVLSNLVERGYPPKLVVTQNAKSFGRGQKLKSTDVARFAKEKGLPVIETENVNDPKAIEELEKIAPEVIFVVAFGQLLKSKVLELPKYCLNLHASLLPKYRGAAPVQYAILNGDLKTGVTIQKMVKALDAGDIFVQKEIPISEEDTSGTLLEKLAKLGVEAAIEAFSKIKAGDVQFTPQDPEQVSLAPKIQKEQAEIDWTQNAKTILNQIHALQPWPVANTVFDSQKLRIFKATIADSPKEAAPGTITTDGKELMVSCGEQTGLLLTEIQLENRKRLGVEDFLKGFRGALPVSKLGKS